MTPEAARAHIMLHRVDEDMNTFHRTWCLDNTNIKLDEEQVTTAPENRAVDMGSSSKTLAYAS